MKLYYSPGACSLAPHIIAREAGIAIDLVKVDLGAHRTEKGEDYFTISPRGYVPAIEIDGELHTEVVALVQYLAEQAPQSNLLPPAGTMERFRVNQWLAFVSSELHKTFQPVALARTRPAESTKQAAREKIATRFAELDRHLAARPVPDR